MSRGKSSVATVEDIAEHSTDADVVTKTAVPSVTSRFDDLAQDAAVLDTVEAVLSDAEAKEALKGVPIIITKVVYRDDTKNAKGQYVSMECVVGPNVGAFPKDSVVVINDGSTGAFRQITAYLEAQSLVSLPDGRTTGGAGETRFDTPFGDWSWSVDAEVSEDEEGTKTVSLVLPRPFMCRKGVRLSVHAKGTTTYLA